MQLNADFGFLYVGVVRPNVHAESQRHFGDFLTDAAETDNTDRFAAQLEARFIRFFQFFKIATGCQFAVAALQHAG